jgi:hypothetical protein
LIRVEPFLVPLKTPQSIKTKAGRPVAGRFAFDLGPEAKQSRKQSPSPVRYIRTVTPDRGACIRRSRGGALGGSAVPSVLSAAPPTSRCESERGGDDFTGDDLLRRVVGAFVWSLVALVAVVLALVAFFLAILTTLAAG